MLFSRDLRRIPEALPYACHPEAGSFGRRISGLNGAIIKNEILRAVKPTLRMTPESSHSERSDRGASLQGRDLGLALVVIPSEREGSRV